MRVLHVLPSMRRAGAESVVAALCRGMVAAGCDVHLVILGGASEYADELSSSGVHLHHLNAFSGPVRFFEFRRRRRIVVALRNAIGEIRPDVVHAHLIHAVRWTGLAIKSGSVCDAYVVTFHGSSDELTQNGGIRALLRQRAFVRSVRRSQPMLLAVSSSVAREYAQLLGLPRKSVEVQANPAPAVSARSQPKSVGARPNVLVVGTMYPVKRHTLALEALAVLLSAVPDAVVTMVGDGPDRERLERYVDELGIRQHVVFAGVRNDVSPFYAQSDVLWLLSAREGMPMVLLEAMAHGVPIVAADVRGINELVVHGKNGLLVGDAPAAVATSTEAVLAEAGLRQRLIEGGYATVGQVQLPAIVQQHVARYRQAMLRRSGT